MQAVYATLDPKTGTSAERRLTFDGLAEQLRLNSDSTRKHMGGIMTRFAPGLFVGADDLVLPDDNLDLERWFKQPKAHERRIHGHAHAGVRLVQQGPTLMLALDAHLRHPAPFSAVELAPYHNAPTPPAQQDAEHRRKIMRKARSRKKRPALLADLEKRYQSSGAA